MKYAYSSSLKIVISASNFKLSKFSNNDLYCPYCGERVSFFTESSGIFSRQAHFRHYHGTYRNDCENYFIGTNSSYKPIKKINEIIQSSYSIYFEKRNNSYSFLYAVKFSESEIQKYQAINSYLHLTIVNNGRRRDIKTEINHVNFIDGKRTFIRLGDAGQKIISVLENESSQINFISGITFFKILGDAEWSDGDFIAKKIPNGDDARKYKLFLNEKYILVVPKHSVISNSLNVIRSEKYIFENVDVYFIEFNKIDISAKEFCSKGGYELCEGKATLDILWPPCFEIGDTYFIKDNVVFLKTNFPLVYGESINTHQVEDGEKFSCISIDKETIIDAENIHCEIGSFLNGTKVCSEYDNLSVDYEDAAEYKAQDDNACLIFPYGVKKLNKYQKIKLNLAREIRLYKSNYVVKIVRYPMPVNAHKNIIKNVIWFNRKSIRFSLEKILYKGNNPYVWEYLQRCRKTHMINEKVLELLEGEKDD